MAYPTTGLSHGNAKGQHRYYQEKNIWATPGPWPSRNTRDAPTNASRIGTWYCRVATQIPPKTPVPVNPCLMTFGVWFVPTYTRFPATQYTIWTQLQLETNFTDGRVADCDHPRHLRRLVVGWRRKTVTRTLDVDVTSAGGQVLLLGRGAGCALSHVSAFAFRRRSTAWNLSWLCRRPSSKETVVDMMHHLGSLVLDGLQKQSSRVRWGEQ